MSQPFKTGRLPAMRPAALKELSVYAAGPLPTPPATCPVPGQDDIARYYPLDGNATYGDCTIAGVAHLITAWDFQMPELDVIFPTPDEAAVIATWRSLNGNTEEGLVEADVLKAWQTTGLFGEKIAAYAPVSTTSLLEQHQAIAFYGGCYLGIQCPESAQRAFQRQQETGETVPWIYEGESTQDGHCVVALGYGPNGGLHCATWGGVAVLEPSFLAHYLQEAWVILPQQMVDARGDALGVDLDALRADLARI